MANAATSVLVGVTGTVSTAAAGVAMPTDVDDSLNASFTALGYVSDDGVKTSVDEDTNEIKAWQGGDIVRKIRTSHEFSVSFTCLETNPKVLEVFYGNFTAGTGGGGAASGLSTVSASTANYRGEWVIDVLDGVNQIRIVLPDAEVTEHGEIAYVNGDAISYPLTLTAYADVSGNKAYIYFEAGAAS